MALESGLVQVLLLAGSKGFNTQKIADLSNAHKLMGNEIIGETSSAKRKLYNSLKNCPSYILSIGNGYFAHSAFPGNPQSNSEVYQKAFSPKQWGLGYTRLFLCNTCHFILERNFFLRYLAMASTFIEI